jgi:hypothetical protein
MDHQSYCFRKNYYSIELKHKICKEHMEEGVRLRDLVRKCNLSSHSLIHEWLRNLGYLAGNNRRITKCNYIGIENVKPHFINDAHITIARRLKPWQYESGWLEYSHNHFTGKFIANKMILLRKKDGDNKFKPIERFEFQNLPVETKQGELFYRVW